MPPKLRQRRQRPYPETDTTADILRDDLRRSIDDEDQENTTVSDYEREINRLDAAARSER